MKNLSTSWAEVSLGKICEFKYGKSLPELKRTGGNIPVFGSNGIIGQHNEAITDGSTIVIGRKGSLGEVNFSNVSCWPIDTTYYIDKSATDTDLKWLAYQLSALGLTKLNKAAAVPGLNREDAYRQRLLLPPLEEQRRIAEILDRAQSLISKRREAIAQLDTLTQAIFIEMFGDPATNPKGWIVDRLEKLIINSLQNGLYKHSSDYGVGTPILRIDAFYDGKVTKLSTLKRVRVSQDEQALYKLNEGDIVINRVNSMEYLGKSALIPPMTEPIVFESNMMRFSVNLEIIVPCYLVEFLQSKFIKGQILSSSKNAVNQSSINQQDVKGFLINIPPLPLQKEFASRVEAVEKLKASHRASLSELDALFASLQHRAFRGEL